MGITEIIASTPGEGPSTRVTYEEGTASEGLTVKWSVSGDEFLYTNESEGKWYGNNAFSDYGSGGTTSCTFSLSTPLKAGSLFALYPLKQSYEQLFYNQSGTVAQSLSLPLPLNGQTGKLGDMKDYDYMTAYTKVAVDKAGVVIDENLPVKFKHKIAVLRLAGLTFTGLADGNATEISISGTGLKTQGMLTVPSGLSAYTVAANGDDGIIATSGSFAIGGNGKLTENVYICFFPGQVTGLKVTATVGSDSYEYSYAGSVKDFAEGQMYTLTDAEMTKASAGAADKFDNEGQPGVDGSEDYPYKIATPAQLALLATRVNDENSTWGDKCYELTADIDLKNAEWTPIGNDGHTFNGVFDGGAHTISGLKISSGKFVGLFGAISEAQIYGVSVEGDVTANQLTARVGGIIGKAEGNVIVVACSFSGSVKSTAYTYSIGGIVGSCNGGGIVGCCSTLTTLSADTGGLTAGNKGGICGYATVNDVRVSGCIWQTVAGTTVACGTKDYAGTECQSFDAANGPTADDVENILNGAGIGDNVGGDFIYEWALVEGKAVLKAITA